jgi:hypothetical protein
MALRAGLARIYTQIWGVLNKSIQGCVGVVFTAEKGGVGCETGDPTSLLGNVHYDRPMTPSEMQATIDRLRRTAQNLCLIASEPGQTPVHPHETIAREEVPTTRATADEVESVLAEF